MSDQKLCPTCGTEYPLSERFCPRDGTALRSANAQADLLGSIIADRYHILKKLGEGGMGTVYLAEHVKMGRKSALKVMNPGMNTDPDAIARFNREASNASRLSHPNICGIYDFGETPEGMIYLAMEFIEGSSLTSLIEKAGALPAPRAASIVHQTADALQVAHDAGIVHRDLKPDNIMVAKNRDGSDLVKVVDFGIAKASSSDAQKVTKTGLVVGTPEYMSPEQLAGDKLDGRSDIYSLGLVAFNALTGGLPFPGETAQEAMIMRLTDRPKTLAEVRPEVAWPEAVQAAMDKALARDADERYASAAQFGRDLAAAIADMPVTAAAEAGTMVIGAQGNTRAAGGATTPMPATRVSRNSAATIAMEAKTPKQPAAAAPRSVAPKRSAMPAVFGGVGGIAAITFVVFKFVLPNFQEPTPTTNPVGTDSSGAQVQTDTGTRAGTVTPPNTDPGTATKGTTPQTRPQQQTGNGTTNPPSDGGRTGTQTPPVGSGGPSIAARLESWLKVAHDTLSTESAHRRVLLDLADVRPTLNGALLAESWYVEMETRMAMGDVAGACTVASRVLALSSDASRKEIATMVRATPECRDRP